MKFFSVRFPTIRIDSVVSQVITYPFGKFLEKILPTRRFKFLGRSFSLNPGPFNQKEHMLCTVMATIGLSYFYAGGIFELQILPMFFDQAWARNPVWQHCIGISMQCMGYGLAGLARIFIVFPDYCIYPSNLATFVLNRSLHEKRSGSTFEAFGHMVTRYRYFLALSAAYFIWHVTGPGYCFQALDNFNWPTWFNQKSKLLTFLFGGVNGLGLNPFPTMDWTRTTALGINVESPSLKLNNDQPFVTPYFTIVNAFVGCALVGFLFLVPIYLNNIWYSGYLPFTANGIFDRTGKRFKLKAVVDARGNLDIAKFRSYSVFPISSDC